MFINVSDPAAQQEQMQKIIGKQFVATSSLAQDFQQIVERALRFGLTLYVTNAEDYDPLLNTCIEYATQVGSHAGYL